MFSSLELPKYAIESSGWLFSFSSFTVFNFFTKLVVGKMVTVISVY